MNEPNLSDRIKAWREDDNQGYDSATLLLCEVEDRLVVLERELAEARATVEMRDGTLMMTVHRLEGMVEGRPTERVNFLQRIDELREKETTLFTLQRQVRELVQSWQRRGDEEGRDDFLADCITELAALIP